MKLIQAFLLFFIFTPIIILLILFYVKKNSFVDYMQKSIIIVPYSKEVASIIIGILIYRWSNNYKNQAHNNAICLIKKPNADKLIWEIYTTISKFNLSLYSKYKISNSTANSFRLLSYFWSVRYATLSYISFLLYKVSTY